MLPLVSAPNDVWETSTEIPYWWRVNTQIWVVLLIGWIKFPMRLDQSEVLPRSGWWRVISMEFLRSFFRRHLAGKPVIASPNVGCLLWLNVQYLRGFLSMHTCWKICCRKDGGLSCTTCCTLSRVFKYSINLLIKFTKCPACLIFPGTASSKISSGKTGLDNTVSVSLAVLASRNPWTSLLYSSLNLLASLSLILTEKNTYVEI